MKLIAILVVLVFQRSFGHTPVDQPDRWFDSILMRFSGQFGSGTTAFGMLVVLPAVILWLFLWWIDSWLISLVLDVTVLIYAIGPGKFREALADYLDLWNQNKETEAYQLAVSQLGLPEQEIIPGRGQLHRQIRDSLVLGTFNRFFTTIFWYLVFGAAGALLVRLTDRFVDRLDDPEQPHQARNFQVAMRWLPVRIQGLVFALVGDFVNTFNRWFKDLADSVEPARNQLLRYAFLAQGIDIEKDLERDWSTAKDEQVRQSLQGMLSLIERARLIWLAGIALSVILIP